MLIRVYVDDSAKPVAELAGSSGRVKLDTTSIPDGTHRLRLETVEDDRVTGRREIPFTVRNGPGIAVAGLSAARRGARQPRASRSTPPARASTPISTCARSNCIAACRSGPACSRSRSSRSARSTSRSTPLRSAPRGRRRLAISGDNASLARAAAGSPVRRRPDAGQSRRRRVPAGAADFDPGKADTARGAATYAAKCAGCHGATVRRPHRAVRDARRAGRFPAPRRPARRLPLPPALELRQWLARQHGDAAARRRPHRGRLDRHRRASRDISRRASHRRRPSPPTSPTSAVPSPPPAGPSAASARACAAMGRTASASHPISPR